jgi:hypothetical protein
MALYRHDVVLHCSDLIQCVKVLLGIYPIRFENPWNVYNGGIGVRLSTRSVCQPGPFVHITTSPTKFSTSFGPFGITFDSDQRHPPVLPISALGRPIHADSGNKSEQILLKQAEYMTDPTDFSEYH